MKIYLAVSVAGIAMCTSSLEQGSESPHLWKKAVHLTINWFRAPQEPAISRACAPEFLRLVAPAGSGQRLRVSGDSSGL
jgi:hypothetical protein